jgi:drug/metabolite transporter (DMT)-like permease
MLAPILTDGSRFVGEAWPTWTIDQNRRRRQQNFCIAQYCSAEHFLLRAGAPCAVSKDPSREIAVATSQNSTPTGPAAARPLDWALLAVLVVLGGSSFTFIHLAIETMPPVGVTTGRLWIAAIALFAIMSIRGMQFPPLLMRTKDGISPHPAWRSMMAVGIVGYAIPFLIFPWAQQEVASGLAGLYMAFMPLSTLGLAYFFADEALTPQKIAGFALGAVGVALLIGPEAISGVAGSSVLAQAALLLATFLYAGSAVISRRAPPIRPTVFSAGTTLMGALCASPALLFAEADPASWSLASMTSVLILGLGPTAAAGFVIIVIIQRAGAGFMALANYVTPVFAVVAGAVLFHERLHPTAFAALAIILIGVAVSQHRGKARTLAPALSDHKSN